VRGVQTHVRRCAFVVYASGSEMQGFSELSMPNPGLTLKKAMETSQLEAFIAQAEAAGVGPVSEADFTEAVRRVATPRQRLGRTSRSASRGDSTGK
jgi:hypothetical protein